MENHTNTCKIEGCGKRVVARGACHTHYKRWQTSGQYNLNKKVWSTSCSELGCELPKYARNLCSKHFNKLRRSEGYFAVAIRTPKARFSDCKRYAKNKNLVWNITFEQFCESIKQTCHYCAGALPQTKTGMYRKDNEKGYTLDNVVPCCYACNQIRSNSFTYDEFVEFSKTDLFKRISDRKKHKLTK